MFIDPSTEPPTEPSAEPSSGSKIPPLEARTAAGSRPSDTRARDSDPRSSGVGGSSLLDHAASPRAPIGTLPATGLTVPRVLGCWPKIRVGEAEVPSSKVPLLIAVAGLHGNEPAGVLALLRVVRRLEDRRSGSPAPTGRFVALAGNLRALACGRRRLDRDLNRMWTPETLERLWRKEEKGPGESLQPRAEGSAEVATEMSELAQLAGQLDELLAPIAEDLRHRVLVLDLHTASGPGPAFTLFDDSLRNRELALALEVPVVLGIEEELGGTMIQHVSELGCTAVAFESGRHGDPMAIDRAEAAVWVALETCGVLPPGEPCVGEARRRLRETARDLPRVVEVRYRHAVTRDDRFCIAEGVSGFQTVERGRVLGRDRRGPVAARERGLVLMPLYQEVGDEGFFLVRPVQPLWLSVSKTLRRWRLERWLHWLPGVRRHPQLAGSFRVDRRIARWVAPQLFHLLGFRRHGRPEGPHLVMSRRRDDRGFDDRGSAVRTRRSIGSPTPPCS